MGHPRNSTTGTAGKDPRLVEVGARIAEARRELGIEQTEFADLVHVSPKAVSLWETGRTSPHRKIKEISQVLGRPEAWFWHGDTPEEESRRLLHRLVTINQQILDEVRLLRIESRDVATDVPM